MPVVGRLFSQTRDNVVKTEIVLLITPRLVRQLARPDVRSAEFAAGTEASSGVGPGVVPSFVPLPLQPAPAEQAPVQTPPVPAKPAPSGADQVPFGGVQPAPQ
jgi:general secretion pathway protein D